MQTIPRLRQQEQPISSIIEELASNNYILKEALARSRGEVGIVRSENGKIGAIIDQSTRSGLCVCVGVQEIWDISSIRDIQEGRGSEEEERRIRQMKRARGFSQECEKYGRRGNRCR